MDCKILPVLFYELSFIPYLVYFSSKLQRHFHLAILILNIFQIKMRSVYNKIETSIVD